MSSKTYWEKREAEALKHYLQEEQEYQAPLRASYQNMLDRLTRRPVGGGRYITIHNGSVIVMHMQNSAKYTAQALDEMIPKWRSQGYDFARSDDYLGV